MTRLRKMGCALGVVAALAGGVLLVVGALYLIERTPEERLFGITFGLALAAMVGVLTVVTRLLVRPAPAARDGATADGEPEEAPAAPETPDSPPQPRSGEGGEGRPVGELRELPPLRVLDVFVVGRVAEPVRITSQRPLSGELMRDREGRYSLSPEEDERGEGMGAIALPGVADEDAAEWVGRLVEVSGVFHPSRGLTVETLRLRP